MVVRAVAAPSEWAKMTSGSLVLIEEAMRSVAARTEDGESPSQNLKKGGANNLSTPGT